MFNPFRRLRSTSSAVATQPTSEDLLAADVIDEISHLEWLSRNVVDGLLAGKHRSKTKGGCSEFAQHRQYVVGDEIRQIDWQVYARNDKYFVKQFEEETNLHALLAIDTSGSMNFQMAGPSKLMYAKRAAACLARLLLHQRDAVGAVLLQDTQPLYVPPRQHAAHFKALLSALQNANSGGGGQLGGWIRSAAPRMQRRGMFVLFSDCFGDLNDLGSALRIVRARGHDVIVMHVMAPEELTFDFRHWSSFRSLEAANQRISLDPPMVRQMYLRRVGEFVAALQEMVIALGGDYVPLRTDQDLAESLGWFLRSRLAKSGGARR